MNLFSYCIALVYSLRFTVYSLHFTEAVYCTSSTGRVVIMYVQPSIIRVVSSSSVPGTSLSSFSNFKRTGFKNVRYSSIFKVKLLNGLKRCYIISLEEIFIFQGYKIEHEWIQSFAYHDDSKDAAVLKDPAVSGRGKRKELSDEARIKMKDNEDMQAAENEAGKVKNLKMIVRKMQREGKKKYNHEIDFRLK